MRKGVALLLKMMSLYVVKLKSICKTMITAK